MSRRRTGSNSSHIYGDIKLFSGTASPDVSEEIAKYLNLELSGRDVVLFSNDNLLVRLHNSVRGQDVYVIQTTSRPVHRNLMELLIMIQTLRLDSAARITAVIPFLNYARSDKKDQPRISLTARLVADMIEVAGADRYITLDLHAGQIQGFFSIPGDVLTTFHMINKFVADELLGKLKNPVVVTTDLGFAKRGRNFAENIDAPLALIEKRRTDNNSDVEALNLVGEVTDRDVIIIDDEVDTAGSVVQAVELVKKHGAKDIYLIFVHAVLSGKAAERLANLPIKQIITTDTIPMPIEKKELLEKNLTILHIAPLLAEVIRRAHEGRSVGEMFNE